MILAGDLGGTKTLLGLFQRVPEGVLSVRERNRLPKQRGVLSRAKSLGRMRDSTTHHSMNARQRTRKQLDTKAVM